MLFNYTSVDQTGAQKKGSIDAVNVDVAIASLQRRGLTITSIDSAEDDKSFLQMNLSFFDRVSNKDVVILSRQLATLFEAQVSALRIFRLLSAETENHILGSKLTRELFPAPLAPTRAIVLPLGILKLTFSKIVRSGESG